MFAINLPLASYSLTESSSALEAELQEVEPLPSIAHTSGSASSVVLTMELSHCSASSVSKSDSVLGGCLKSSKVSSVFQPLQMIS